MGIGCGAACIQVGGAHDIIGGGGGGGGGAAQHDGAQVGAQELCEHVPHID